MELINKSKLIDTLTEIARESANEHKESKPTIDYREEYFSYKEIIEIINGETTIDAIPVAWIEDMICAMEEYTPVTDERSITTINELNDLLETWRRHCGTDK